MTHTYALSIGIYSLSVPFFQQFKMNISFVSIKKVKKNQ